MKVSNLNSDSQTVQYINQNAKDQAEQKTGVQGGAAISALVDKVEISSQSQDFKKIRDVLEVTPDVRTEKVASLKEAVQSGKYQVKAEDIADKMLREMIVEMDR